MKAKTMVALALCVTSIVLAGCGGGSSGDGSGHTYILTPSSSSAKGLYITIDSPVAFPQSLLDMAKNNARFVKHAAGPQVCSYPKKIEGVTGKYDDLNGKTVTVRINGTNSTVASQVCSILKNARFNPADIVGASS